MEGWGQLFPCQYVKVCHWATTRIQLNVFYLMVQTALLGCLEWSCEFQMCSWQTGIFSAAFLLSSVKPSSLGLKTSCCDSCLVAAFLLVHKLWSRSNKVQPFLCTKDLCCLMTFCAEEQCFMGKLGGRWSVSSCLSPYRSLHLCLSPSFFFSLSPHRYISLLSVCFPPSTVPISFTSVSTLLSCLHVSVSISLLLLSCLSGSPFLRGLAIHG